MKNSHVAIIGAGATGVAAFIALVRHQSCNKITLLDALGPGVGQVYTNQHPDIICNTSVGLMSLLPPDHQDLLHYLRKHWDKNSTLSDFIPRRIIGEYIRQRYQDYLSLAHQYGIKVKFIADSGRYITRQKQGGYLIKSTHGNAFYADDVIVCSGYDQPKIPDALKPYKGSRQFFASPYPEKQLQQHARPGSHVLIMDTKLSAIDTALVLCRHGCKVKLVSSSGELPAVRSALIYRTVPASRLTQLLTTDFIAHSFKHNLRKCLHQLLAESSTTAVKNQFSFATDVLQRLQEEAELARNHRTEWQFMIAALAEIINQAFYILPSAGKAALVAEIKQAERYIGAMPLQNADKLLGYAREGLLTCEKLNPNRFTVQKTDSGWIVSGLLEETEFFDTLVCATGYDYPLNYATTDSFILSQPPDRSNSRYQLTPELQLQFADSPLPERIWLAGISTHLTAPLINALYIAVGQVNQIAQAIRQL